MAYWTVEPDWQGQDAFIICGGTSVTQRDVDLLRGQHVIAVNSSYLKAPWAEMLFFADLRWWKRELDERIKEIESFQGIIVTTSRRASMDGMHRLKKGSPPGLSPDRSTAVVERTSLHGALNICFHKAPRRILLLGADNRDGPDGRSHHHDEYPWSRRLLTWEHKQGNLSTTVKPLKKAGIPVINCSAISTLPWWPKVPLSEAIRSEP